MVIWYPSLRIIVFSLNHVTISTRQKWWKLNKMKRKSLCKMKQKKKREIKACNGSSFLEIHFPLKSSTVDLSTSDLFWFSIQIISVCRSIYTINTVFISLYRISQKKKTRVFLWLLRALISPCLISEDYSNWRNCNCMKLFRNCFEIVFHRDVCQ